MNNPVVPVPNRRPSLTCSRTGDELAELAALLVRLAARSVAPPERTPTGYILHISTAEDTLSLARRFIDLDKECCPFLDFDLKAGEHGARLDVRGPENAQDLLELCVALALAVGAAP